MAELKVRNVPIEVVQKIDEQYKKKGFKSREDYLRDRLLLISEEDDILDIEKKYSKIIDDILKSLGKNTEALKSFLEFNCINLSSEVEKEREKNG